MEKENLLKDEEIKNLEIKIKSSLDNSNIINNQWLSNVRQSLNRENETIVNNYSNEIRNLSITSGVIAPFSLTLLNVDNLKTNSCLLLWGFSFLISNIIISNYFINKEIKKKDKKIIRADIEWLFAKFSNDDVGNLNKDFNSRVDSNFDVLKRMRAIDHSLGTDALDINNQESKSFFRKYNKISFTLFSLGTSLVILSVISEPIYNLLTKLYYILI